MTGEGGEVKKNKVKQHTNDTREEIERDLKVSCI